MSLGSSAVRIAVFGLAVAAATAWAQPAQSRPSYELEQVQVDPGGAGGLVVNGGGLLPHGQVSASLLGVYDYDPVVYSLDGQGTSAAVVDRFTSHLVVTMVPLRTLQLELQAPVVLLQDGKDLGAFGVSSPAARGVGSATVSARAMLASQAEGYGLDGAFDLAVRLPSLMPTAPGGEQTFVLVPRLSVGRTVSFARVEAGAGLRLRQPEPGTAYRPRLDVSVGAVTSLSAFVQEVDLVAHVPFDGAPASADFLVGGRFSPSELFEVFLLIGPGVGPSPSFTFRVLTGMTAGKPVLVRRRPLPSGMPAPVPPAEPPPVRVAALAPAPAPSKPWDDLDDDGDGVLNRVDECPSLAGLAALKGCPDRDSDGDGLNDSVDKCPYRKGVPDVQGCPIKDADGDGVADAEDECVDEPGPVERRGCPLRDADGDGIDDAVDDCPEEPGVPELHGCPVRDRDGDGVADPVDNCPDQKGPANNQGCPPKIVQLVIITRERLVIKDKVFFETAKAKVLSRSFGLLNQVAAVMDNHPELDRVVVEGHTDNRGGSELNRKLSQARADSVRDYLLKRGVAAIRLQAVGYGPSRPVATNTTARGREQNRRVEFVIVNP